MEILSLKMNTSGVIIGDNRVTYEIVYRDVAGNSPSTVNIEKDNEYGQKITKALVMLKREKITQAELMEVVVSVVEDNGPAALVSALSEVSEAISARIKLIDNVELVVSGHTINGALYEHIMSMIKARRKNPELVDNESWLSLINFTELLYDNVDEEVRDQLYSWMQYQIRNGRLTLTPEGKFYGYKGVKADFGSIHAGPGIVNGIKQKGHLDNSPGNVIEMDRESVNADRTVTCSTGLHVGSYDYAKSFAQGQVLLVEVDPRDVVSVPNDYNGQKIRACKYRVISAVEDELTEFSMDFTAPKDTANKTPLTGVAKVFEDAIDNETSVKLFSYTNRFGGKKDYTNFYPEKIVNDSVLGKHDFGYGQFKFEFVELPVTQAAESTSEPAFLKTLKDAVKCNGSHVSKIETKRSTYHDFEILELRCDRVIGKHSDGYATLLFDLIKTVDA